MDKSEVKRRVLEAVEKRSGDIIDVGEWIWSNPEVGFKEYKTAEYTG